MNPEELEYLQQESNKGNRCPYSRCECYLDRPICHNHAHVNCNLYLIEKRIEKDLEILRNYDGWGILDGD